MGSVASDVGNFVSDTVSSVGDIGQSVIDAGSDIVESVGSGVSDAAQSVSDAFAQIDPGPAIGDAGAAIDQVVNDVIPGGWYMVGAIAATIATAGTVNLEGEALAAGATGEVVAATTAAEAAAAGTAATEGVAAASATTTAAASGSTAAQAALQSAATGALKGAAIGAAKSAITGGDIIQGAFNGALTGAIGGGVGSYASGLTAGTDLADYAKTVGAVAGGTAGGATGAALSGRDPLTGALIGGISGGTSSVASNILPSDINPAITSAGLGAARAAIMGGDPLTAALTSAGGSLINQGVGAGYDAVKSGLNSLDATSPPPTQTADITQDPNYKAAIEAGFNPDEAKALAQGASDPTLPGYAPVASNGTVTVTGINDVPEPLIPLVTPAANSPEAFPDKTSPTGYSNNNGDPVNADGSTYTSPLDTTLAATIDGGLSSVDKTIPSTEGGLPSIPNAPDDKPVNHIAMPNVPEGYSLQPPDSSNGMPRAYTTDMPPDGSTWAYNNTTGERIAVPVNGGGNGPIAGTGDGNGTGGSGSGGFGDGNNNAPAIEPPPPTLPPTAGGGSGSGGSGGGGGSGGIGSGLGSIVGGSALTAQQLNNQATNPGLMNLTPGLTKPMDYDLAGLSHYATGGSTTSKNSSALFDDKGAYNYGNLSDTPLTAALTKHNVGYTLTGLPSKANGGLMQPMTGGGQFGVSGNFGTNDKVPTEHPTHQPQFFSEGGASLANRYVKGAGDGTSDSIPAMLANGEFVIPADVVSNLGNGSNDSGAKILDEFLRVIREHKTKHDARRLPPNSKGPLSYLTDAKRKVKK